MYNRRMNKRILSGIILATLGLICLGVGMWPFKLVSFEVPVTLGSGQTAIVSGRLPATAWVEDPFKIDLTFKLTSKVEGTEGHLRTAVEIHNAGVLPSGEVSLAFDPAAEVNLSWKATPLTSGNLKGTLWVYAGLSSQSEQAVLARDLKINSVDFLGVSAAWYRRIGIGFLAGGLFLILAFSTSSRRTIRR